MKKWFATYLFFVGFLFLSLSGMAGSRSGSTAQITRNHQVSCLLKAKIVYGPSQQHDDQSQEITRPRSHALAPAHSLQMLFLDDSQPGILPSTISVPSIPVPTTRVLKTYLLFLFPTHYFW